MRAILATSVILSALLSTASATWSFGGCQSPNTKSSFDVDQYIGSWYEAARDSKIIFEYGDCVQARYDWKSDTVVRVRNSQVNPKTGNIDAVDGSATCKDNGICKVGFFLFRNGDYRVVDTDYTNYAVVYGCSSYFFGLFKSENVWILSRAKNIDPTVLSNAETIITTELPEYALSNLYYTDHSASCIYKTY
ncbi:hypothetical protein FGO68_gene10463 [Halteria grandinella]|uniref:Lipocalin/cytosolic fatty-acid binding domain-containing protein n=1 Tax=Halteria grandinella TaxID=5974 RepID=A0A8J8NL68_HALGN|nr:hypothetical protein FGO68_gene10463 [Halteria grandinella]